MSYMRTTTLLTCNIDKQNLVNELGNRHCNMATFAIHTLIDRMFFVAIIFLN